MSTIHTWCGLSVNLECRSETCCAWLAGNTARKKITKSRHLGTIPKLCPAISLQLRHVSTIGKNLVKQQYLLHNVLYNMVNFGPLVAEICWRVWGTLANSTGFASWQRYCTAFGVSQTLLRWTEGAAYIPQGGHHVGHWPTF